MVKRKGNPHKHHYKYGKQTTPIDFQTFSSIMENGKFVKPLRDKSFLAFLYWFGVRCGFCLFGWWCDNMRARGGFVDRQFRAYEKDGCIVRVLGKRKTVGGTALDLWIGGG